MYTETQERTQAELDKLLGRYVEVQRSDGSTLDYGHLYHEVGAWYIVGDSRDPVTISIHPSNVVVNQPFCELPILRLIK